MLQVKLKADRLHTCIQQLITDTQTNTLDWQWELPFAALAKTKPRESADGQTGGRTDDTMYIISLLR